jgi:acetoin utilization protein AcuB
VKVAKKEVVMYVRDFMRTEVVTLDVSDHLDVADGIMRLGRIRHLPVVEGERVVGIVSERDLFRAAVSSLLQLDFAAEREWLAKIPVRGVMNTRVFTIPPSASLRSAVKIMAEKKIGCLPVVDEGHLVGLISESDCLAHLAHLLEIAAAKDDLPEFAPT